MSVKRMLFWWKTATLTAILVFLAGCQASTDTPMGASPSPEPEAGTLPPEERAELLKLARDTIATYLRENRVLSYKTDNPYFLRPGGAFVTLKKHGELRGCIGHMQSQRAIYQTVQEMAIAAAVQDPRFPPVRLDELPELTVEISLLSPMEPVTDVNQIVVGKHGLLIRQGPYQGVLLPQVAPEQGWDREQYLQGICHKAGLPSNAWRDPATKLYSFTAEVFGEGE